MKAWVAANTGVELVEIYETMQDPLRPTYMNPAYTADGIHPNVTTNLGVEAHAEVLVARLTIHARLKAWRQQHFGTTSNTGNAADLADIDLDGIVNLLEYALGGDPNIAGQGVLPQSSVIGGKLALTFTRNVVNTDITITVQASETMSGVWTGLARSVNGGAMTALVTGVAVTETGAEETRTVEVRDVNDVTDPAHPHRIRQA